jgi:hypothetical protein
VNKNIKLKNAKKTDYRLFPLLPMYDYDFLCTVWVIENTLDLLHIEEYRELGSQKPY